MSEKINNFVDLYEIVQIHEFENESKNIIQFKKAVLISRAPKKAVLISKAPIVKKLYGGNFTPRKKHINSRLIHYTNAKNSFERAQKNKSRKSKKE